MNDSNGYAVFFFPQALESLGEAIKPYLREGPSGPHVLCNEIDTGGALIEMTLFGGTPDASRVELQLMVPSGMVQMVVSTHSEELFGFRPRTTGEQPASLPAVGPNAAPAAAAPQALPTTTADDDVTRT